MLENKIINTTINHISRHDNFGNIQEGLQRGSQHLTKGGGGIFYAIKISTF